jgi:hypothetical protein
LVDEDHYRGVKILGQPFKHGRHRFKAPGGSDQRNNLSLLRETAAFVSHTGTRYLCGGVYLRVFGQTCS